MKKLLLASVMVLAMPLAAWSATLEFPSDDPVASIEIPDSWTPKETETGVDAASDDGAIYFSVDVADQASSDQIINTAIDFLGQNGVKIDPATLKESPEVEINGMKVSTLDYQGTDKDGPVDVSLGFAAPAGDKILVFTYWGLKETQDAHSDEVVKILASMKPMK